MKPVCDEGRRRFLTGIAPAALAVPAMLQAAGNQDAKTRISPAPPSRGTPAKDMTKKLEYIGIEEHWTNDEINAIGARFRAAQLPAQPTPAPMSPRLLEALRKAADFGEGRLADMDSAGVRMQVISLNSPALQGMSDTAKAVDVAKRSNDYHAKMISKHPNRMAGFAALPTQDPKAAADELERAVKQLGFKGTMIHGHTYWQYLDDRKYWVLWERVEALGVPVYLHINDPSADSQKSYAGYPELTSITWAVGVEVAMHALRIICSGVFDAFPKATLILGHLGEMLPYQLGRMDEGYSGAMPAKKLQKKLSEYVKGNLLVTTSGWFEPQSLLCAISAMGADRVLWSGDYPFVDPRVARENFERTPLSPEVREMVAHGNAERWLKLPPASAA